MNRLQGITKNWILVLNLIIGVLIMSCSWQAFAVISPSQLQPSHTPIPPSNPQLQPTGSQLQPSHSQLPPSTSQLDRTNSQLHVMANMQRQINQIQSQDANVINGLSDKINQLQEQNQVMAANLFQTQRDINLLHQQLTTIAFQTQQPITWNQRLYDGFVSWANHSQQMLGAVGFKLVTGLAAVFLLWVIWVLRPRRSKSENILASIDDEVDLQPTMAVSRSGHHLQDQLQVDSEGEYDFLNTAEAIPTKLDLARAYIAMGQLLAAQLVLEEVIEKGNAAQQQTAKDLLAQVESEVS